MTCESAGHPVHPRYLNGSVFRCGERGRGRGWDDVLPFFTETLNDDRGHHSSRTGSIQRPRIEDVHTLHFPENFEPLETGRLLVVRRHGARYGTGTDEIFLRLDLCWLSISICFAGNYNIEGRRYTVKCLNLAHNVLGLVGVPTDHGRSQSPPRRERQHDTGRSCAPKSECESAL